MRRPTLPLAITFAALLGLLVAAPASAAVTGTVCGEVTAFTAPAGAVDGSITINGTEETIDAAATGVADAAATLTLIADARATTCLDIVANGDEVITDIDIASQARICGDVAFDTVASLYTVDGVNVPADLVSADADLAAMLDAAATANASLCVDVTIDGVSGLITTVRVNSTLTLCGDATLDADSATLAGVDIPFSMLDADALALLQLALDADASICAGLVIVDNDLVEANVSADIILCGDVTLDAEGNVVVDGVVIDDALLTASAAALLELTAEADGTACASVDAVSTGGDTTVVVSVTVELCAEVTAMTDDTITIGDVTFVFVGAADADIEIGDEVCIAAAPGPGGTTVIFEIDGAALPGAGGDGPGTALPDTATESGGDLAALGTLLALAAMGIWAIGRERIASLR